MASGPDHIQHREIFIPQPLSIGLPVVLQSQSHRVRFAAFTPSAFSLTAFTSNPSYSFASSVQTHLKPVPNLFSLLTSLQQQMGSSKGQAVYIENTIAAAYGRGSETFHLISYSLNLKVRRPEEAFRKPTVVIKSSKSLPSTARLFM